MVNQFCHFCVLVMYKFILSVDAHQLFLFYVLPGPLIYELTNRVISIAYTFFTLEYIKRPFIQTSSRNIVTSGMFSITIFAKFKNMCCRRTARTHMLDFKQLYMNQNYSIVPTVYRRLCFLAISYFFAIKLTSCKRIICSHTFQKNLGSWICAIVALRSKTFWWLENVFFKIFLYQHKDDRILFKIYLLNN